MSAETYNVTIVSVGISHRASAKTPKLKECAAEIEGVLKRQISGTMFTRRQFIRLLRQLRSTTMKGFSTLNEILLDEGFYPLENGQYAVLLLDHNDRVLGYIDGGRGGCSLSSRRRTNWPHGIPHKTPFHPLTQPRSHGCEVT